MDGGRWVFLSAAALLGLGLAGHIPAAVNPSAEKTPADADILTEWANRRGLRLEYLVMEFASQIPALQTGKADMAMGSVEM